VALGHNPSPAVLFLVSWAFKPDRQAPKPG
jgi:hypothetical protein